MTYEVHVTCPDPNDKDQGMLYSRIAKEVSWKTSTINDHGNSKFYFTSHFKTEETARRKLIELTDILRDRRVKILREKIEHIIYDTKFLHSL